MMGHGFQPSPAQFRRRFLPFRSKGNAMLRKMFDVLVLEFGRAGYALSLQWCVWEPLYTLDELRNCANLDSDAPAAL
jgi:hypothetical protein